MIHALYHWAVGGKENTEEDRERPSERKRGKVRIEGGEKKGRKLNERKSQEVKKKKNKW